MSRNTADLGEAILVVTDASRTLDEAGNLYTITHIFRFEIALPIANLKSLVDHVAKHPSVVNSEVLKVDESV